MAEVLRLIDCQSAFLTRAQGARVRERLVKSHTALREGERLSIDLSGVKTMTPSFADECLGKLAERLGAEIFRATVTLIGANNIIRVLINSVLSHRLAKAKVDRKTITGAGNRQAIADSRNGSV